ncbi:coiled-coil domain-containing protein 191-like isoform X1 [Octopus sinensis]|uniref:Coiled-coil domain-containing protein 191-like isoform X1 n=1 Tax=Octopus sinensis TaxID=2607531 RepID=A0A6P7SES7_9MOLL|nr:coiled-coil domain-containing protein 191-like isoform X1 [Octopus sinensis]
MPLSFFTKSFVSKNTAKADNGIKSSRRKRRLISRSQSNITPSDIQSWLSNIEPTIPSQGYFQNTDDKSYPFSRVKFKQSLAQMTLDQLRHHDEAQKEAEDLLNDWVQKSLYDSNLADKDNLYVIDNKELEEVPCKDYLDIYETDSRLDFNEDEALETVLQNMLKKELVPKRIFSNLGLDNSKQQHDPSVKMELRRQQVKENRLKRENDINQKRQEQQMKKEAHLKAYQRIMKEERLKAIKHQQEEREIQKQMAAIRRQMLAEKKEQKGKKQEQIQLTNDCPQQPATEITPHKNFSSIEQCTTMAKTEQKMAKYEALKVKQKAINIQILQRHFMAWTSVILQKRVRYGKVSALADWKLLLRHWNAWKSLSMQNKMEKELQVHQQNMRECQRKDKMAGEHYITKLMKKCFWTWQLYLHREKECQRLKLSQKETKVKMEKLLIAAASGKINVVNSLSNSETKSKNLTKKKPDIEKCIKQVKISSVPCNSDGSIIGCSQLSSVPWKASRKLLDMETPQFCQLVAGTNTETYSSDQKQTTSRPLSAPNKFQMHSIERKLEFQKNFMKEQQKQLKEQKRLIEELQSNQRCEKLKNEISMKTKTNQGVNINPLSSIKSGGVKQQILNQTSKHSSAESCSPESQVESQTDSRAESRTDSWIESRMEFYAESHIESNTEIQTESEIDSQTDSRIGSRIGSQTESRADSRTDARTGSRTESYDESCPSSSTRTSSQNRSQRHQTFVRNLENRANERKHLKMEREARKRREMEEKLMMEKKCIEECIKAEKDERRARVKAIEQQKHLEEQRKAEQEQRMKELEELNSKADDFYRLYLLKIYGVLPWKEFIAKIHNTESKAIEMDKCRIQKNVLMSWHNHVQKLINEKTNSADIFYEKALVRRHFICWKNHKNYQLALEKKAKKYFASNLCRTVFNAWVTYANEQTIASWEQEEIAQKFYLTHLLQKMLNSWKLLPDIQRKEQERHQRKNELRHKVAMLLPDFYASIDSQVE